jgi:hypothetical protein
MTEAPAAPGTDAGFQLAESPQVRVTVAEAVAPAPIHVDWAVAEEPPATRSVAPQQHLITRLSHAD